MSKNQEKEHAILDEINKKMRQNMLSKMTKWERVKYHYTDKKAALAIWLDSDVIINRWVFISILWVATLSVGFILLSVILGNTMECTVVL